jgi:hypothetical protein
VIQNKINHGLIAQKGTSMTHSDKGHFAAKHPAGTTVAPSVEQAIKNNLKEGRITCAAAHDTAVKLGVSPAEVGIGIDLQDGRIHKCQMGLFGYGSEGKKVLPAKTVDAAVHAAIREALVDGRLACADAWRLAETHGLSRRAIANICETLQIRINRCQLGAF